MSQHTPGPWQVIGHVIRAKRTQVDGAGFMVAECSLHREEAFANAHLIAAAPDLLSALKHAVLWLSEYEQGTHDNLIAECKAAIAKAKGKS